MKQEEQPLDKYYILDEKKASKNYWKQNERYISLMKYLRQLELRNKIIIPKSKYHK